MVSEHLKNKRIGILAGGLSSEREISIKSGKAVFEALSRAGLSVSFIDVADDSLSFLGRERIDISFIALHGKFGEDGTLQKKLQEKHVPYTGSGPEASRMALDKLASKKRFIEKGVRTPEYLTVGKNDELPLGRVHIPCVVKPQFEGSSIGLTVVRNESELGQAVVRALSYEGKALIRGVHRR